MKLFPENKIPSVGNRIVQNEDGLGQAPIGHEFANGDTEFTFSGNRLCFQGKDLSVFIRNSAQHDPWLFAHIAKDLEFYRRKQEKEMRRLLSLRQLTTEKENEIAQILALCEAHLARLVELMQNRYTSMATGCAVEFDEHGQFILNGINVNMALQCYRERPSPPARIYLQGLARRLYFILGQSHQNRLYSRLESTVLGLYRDILAELSF